MRQNGWKTGLQFASRVSVLLAMTWTVCPRLAAAGVAAGPANGEQDAAQQPVLRPYTPATPAPCAARGKAVIANTGKVFSIKGSLVDSYRSIRGPYGRDNQGDEGTVQAGETIERLGGIIRGQRIENTPADLPLMQAPQNAKPLPLGASAPGHLFIHDRHDSITLSPGNYVVEDMEVRFPGEIKVFPAGLVSIFVRGHLILDGEENRDGDPAYLQFVVTGKSDVLLGELDTLTGLLYAPASDVIVRSNVFGSVVGRTARLEEHAEVHFDQSSNCSVAPPKSPAIPPTALPPPPPDKIGCYVYAHNGWKDTPCAPQDYINQHFGRPDAQITVSSNVTAPLVYGQLEVTLPAVQSEQNAFLASTASISPLCQSTGSPVPNQWSIQNNTNEWTIASGSQAGDRAADQFTLQANGTNTAICIWQVNVTSQSYPNSCVMPNVPQRAGGLQPFDAGNTAVTITPSGNISMEGALTWVQSGQPNIYGVVAADSFGLAQGWSQVSGGILGMGVCSQAQLTNAEAVTQIAMSTCTGDTQADSPTCAPPTLQPNATVATGGNGTVETSNLIAETTPSLSYLNSDLVISNQTATTSGGCLGPSHAYVKDSPEDFGAVPSTIGNAVFWESPDLFLVPHGTPVTLNAVSTETTITPGGSYDVWVRVHNDLGCSDVDNVTALVYLANPAALSVQWDSITSGNYVGPNMSTTGVTVPSGGEALIGPLPFTAPTTGIGNGHRCMLAAIQGTGESAPAKSSDAPDFNQVAQRNLEFGGACEYPLTNATTTAGSAQITLSVTPITGAVPSLTSTPDVEVNFDDADSSWFNVWNVQTGAGTAFAVTHNGGAGTTTVRLGSYSVALNAVPLAAGQSRNANGTVNPGSGTLTLQIAATLTETGSSGQVLVSNGGSCTQTAPVIK